MHLTCPVPRLPLLGRGVVADARNERSLWSLGVVTRRASQRHDSDNDRCQHQEDDDEEDDVRYDDAHGVILQRAQDAAAADLHAVLPSPAELSDAASVELPRDTAPTVVAISPVDGVLGSREFAEQSQEI